MCSLRKIIVCKLVSTEIPHLLTVLGSLRLIENYRNAVRFLGILVPFFSLINAVIVQEGL